MKKILSILIMFLIICSLFSTNAYASANKINTEYDKERVFDYANVLNEEQEKSLYKIAQKYDKSELTVIFLTENEMNGETSDNYTNNFYKNKQFTSSGVVFLINMETREIYVNKFGYCINSISDEIIENALNESFSSAVQGNYYDCFVKLENITTDAIMEAGNSENKFILMPSHTSIIASIILTLIVILLLIKIHNKANRTLKGQAYLNQSINVIDRNEIFIGDKKERIRGYYKSREAVNIPVGKNRRFGGRF